MKKILCLVLAAAMILSLCACGGSTVQEEEPAPQLKIGFGKVNVTPNDPVIAPIKSKMKDTAELFTEPKLSWPSDKPEKKIDYIFVSPDIEVLSADIPEIVASDHRPHVAEIKF